MEPVTILLILWVVVMTCYVTGTNPLMLAGKVKNAVEEKRSVAVAARNAKRAELEASQKSQDADSAKEVAHKIRQAEIDAEMHMQDNGFVLTTCGDEGCSTCHPKAMRTPPPKPRLDYYKYEPSSGYSKPYAKELLLSEYRAAIIRIQTDLRKGKIDPATYFLRCDEEIRNHHKHLSSEEAEVQKHLQFFLDFHRPSMVPSSASSAWDLDGSSIILMWKFKQGGSTALYRKVVPLHD